MMRKYSPVFSSFIVVLITFMTACTSGHDDLEGTIKAQNTQIAGLNTQAAEYEKTNWSHWETISNLSTQVPFALGLITLIPEGIMITPTAYIDIEYPPDTRTGIPEIDRVIDIFLASDIEDRVELTRLIQYPYTTDDGLGGPLKCDGDEADGEIVAAYPVLYSEGLHVRPDSIEDVFGFTVRGLLAVYAVPEAAYQAKYWPVGEYVIVFTSEDGGRAHTITLHIIVGEVVRLEFNTGWPPFDHIWDRSDTFILPPSTRPDPTPQLAVCTPPSCASDEEYHCPDECPGGCGTTCATVTPPAQDP